MVLTRASILEIFCWPKFLFFGALQDMWWTSPNSHHQPCRNNYKTQRGESHQYIETKQSTNNGQGTCHLKTNIVLSLNMLKKGMRGGGPNELQMVD